MPEITNIYQCIGKELGKFKDLFRKTVDDVFIGECQQYAISKLKERLKIV